jgi:small-conductance mechanosensitive channel
MGKLADSIEKTYQTYIQLEQNVKSFKESLTQHNESPQLTEAELDRLKEVLKKLSQLDLEYARLLRNYKHSRNTIAINAKNYQVSLDNILRQLQEKDYAVQPSDLDFFRELTDRTCPYFHTRISDELNYFIEGSNLADKAIASIRGIVEIEQTQRDRLRQYQEKHLENTIQALGIAIGAGAIFGSTAALITIPWRSPWASDRSDYPHPFIIGFFGSFFVAICVYGLVKLRQRLSKPKSK